MTLLTLARQSSSIYWSILIALEDRAFAQDGAPPETTPKTNEVTTEEKREQKSPLEQPQTSESTQPAASPWSMFHGNLRRTGLSPYVTSHVDGTVKWSFETGAGVESSPAIGSDGTIYFGSHDNKLYAINPDGTEKWRFNAGEPVYSKEWNVWKGILSSPAIGNDGTIYFGTWDHKLYAIGGSPTREGSEGTTTEKPKATFPSAGPEPIFTVSPVDISRIDFIIPLGNLNPPAHVFPTDHMYFFLTGQMRSARLYSPGDLIVTSITAQEFINASFTDYTLTLKAGDDITVEFGHVNSLSEDVFGDTATYEDWSLSNEYSTGGETYRLWTKNVEIKVTAGEVLGTVGKNRWGNWDFYLFDQRYRPESVTSMATALTALSLSPCQIVKPCGSRDAGARRRVQQAGPSPKTRPFF